MLQMRVYKQTINLSPISTKPLPLKFNPNAGIPLHSKKSKQILPPSQNLMRATCRILRQKEIPYLSRKRKKINSPLRGKTIQTSEKMEPINFYSENYQNNATLYKMLNDYKYSLEKDFTVKTKTSFKEHFLFIKNSKMKPREKKKTEINVQSVRQGSSEKKKLPDKSQYTIISRINKTKQKNGKVHQQLGRNSVDYEGWNTLQEQNGLYYQI